MATNKKRILNTIKVFISYTNIMSEILLLTSKPPISNWRRPNWIPGYSDNPAMKKWYIPDQKIVDNEYEWMTKAFNDTRKSKVFEVKFPNTNEMEVIEKIRWTQNDIKKTFGYNGWVVNPNWEDLVDEKWEFTQHDFVFVRDSFISNQKDKILISNFSRAERKIEEMVIKEILETLTKDNNIDRKIITAPQWPYFEGGNFRYIPDEWILFAWKQNRSNAEWINFVKNEFGVRDDKILMIDWISFHVDTYFSVVTWDDGKLIAWIICPELVNNMTEVKGFFRKNKKILLEVNCDFGMGKEGNGKWNFATNTLQLKEYLVWCNWFDDKTERILQSLWVKRIISPMTEYNRSWGGTHCSSNQI